MFSQLMCKIEHFFIGYFLGLMFRENPLGNIGLKYKDLLTNYLYIALGHPLSKTDEINLVLLIIPTKVIGLI